MSMELNPAPARVMHVDLNSAFAMTEQQADPLLRGKPVGILNRADDSSMCVAASYEAKRLGIGLGTRGFEAKLKAPDFVTLESDPAKYAFVHCKLKAILNDYSLNSYMKSVDEGVIDMNNMEYMLKGRSLENIGSEIKERIRDEIGDYMTVNIGIGQNKWLAKLAASFMKPDGMYRIDRDNLEAVYGSLRLMDLPYIKARNRLRLNSAGVYTPLEFLKASERVLTKQVFRGILGKVWYLKLRGYETEQESRVRTAGRSYVLEKRTSDYNELARLLYRMSLKVARRLHTHSLAARGLALGISYTRDDIESSQRGAVGWTARRMYSTAAWRGDQIYSRALALFNSGFDNHEVAAIYITSYGVMAAAHNQAELFNDCWQKRCIIENTIQTINDRYGEMVLYPATAMAGPSNKMKDKVPFGSVRYLENGIK